jgi:hypothetical protein
MGGQKYLIFVRATCLNRPFMDLSLEMTMSITCKKRQYLFAYDIFSQCIRGVHQGETEVVLNLGR